jgi:hypothetical protein
MGPAKAGHYVPINPAKFNISAAAISAPLMAGFSGGSGCASNCANAAADVDLEAIDLRDPRVALELNDPDACVEQPGRNRCLHRDIHAGHGAKQLVDHRHHARRMAESVSRDVKDDAI